MTSEYLDCHAALAVTKRFLDCHAALAVTAGGGSRSVCCSDPELVARDDEPIQPRDDERIRRPDEECIQPRDDERIRRPDDGRIRPYDEEGHGKAMEVR